MTLDKMALLLILNLVSFFHQVNCSMTSSIEARWSQYPMDSTKWKSGSPENDTVFFCSTNETSTSSKCPEIPPGEGEFVQFVGVVDKETYWIYGEIDSREIPSSRPVDLKLQILNFGVFGQGETSVPSNSSSYDGYVVMTFKLDEIYLSESLFLDQYSILGWNNISVMFRNHTGTPYSLMIEYNIYGYQGPPIRAVFRGLALYWV